MGDRANIRILEEDCSDIYLYTHWDGYKILDIAKAALKRGESCWDDVQYLGRIVFCEMIQDDIMGTTDFGISSVVGDGKDNVVTLNVTKQTIQWSKGNKEWTFAEFVEDKGE